MITIGKTLLNLLLVIGLAAPLGCLTINKTPPPAQGTTATEQPTTPPEKGKTEVNVGGSKGVTVESK